MRFLWLTLAATLGLGTISPAVFAASNADYLTVREQTPPVMLPDAEQITRHFPNQAGQVIELEGTVTGIFSGENHFGYLLRIDAQQTLILSSTQEDPDIAVGKKVRVLARIPQHGTVLESLAATGAGPMLARADLANLRANGASVTAERNTGIDIVPSTQPPVVRYYRVPELAPQTNTQPRPTTPAVNEEQALAKQPYVVQLYAQRIREINNDLSESTAVRIATSLLNESEKHSVDPRLVFALVTQESRFNPRAVSHAGAMGLGQLMPGTAAGLGVRDPFDIEQNLSGSVRYLSAQLNRYGRLSLALAAYNAGPGNVAKYGGIPPFRETQNYVSRIWKHYAKLAGLDPDTGRQIAAQ